MLFSVFQARATDELMIPLMCHIGVIASLTNSQDMLSRPMVLTGAQGWKKITDFFIKIKKI